MVVTGVGGDDLQVAAERAGVHLRVLRRLNEDEVEVHPAPIGTRFLVYRRDGRSLPFACFHAYAEFIRQVYRIEPGAHVETAIMSYRGLDDFLRGVEQAEERWRRKYGRKVYCECGREGGGTGDNDSVAAASS